MPLTSRSTLFPYTTLFRSPVDLHRAEIREGRFWCSVAKNCPKLAVRCVYTLPPLFALQIQLRQDRLPYIVTSKQHLALEFLLPDVGDDRLIVLTHAGSNRK